MRFKKIWAALFIGAAFFFASCAAYGASPDLPTEIRIDDDISPEILVRVSGVSSRLLGASPPSNKNIDMLFFSAGGSVNAMGAIVMEMEKLKAKGYRFRCLAIYAASAAFMIWLQCDERWVLPESRLMFHYPYQLVRGAMGLEDAKRAVTSLQEARNVFDQELMEKLGPYMSRPLITQSALDSKIWTGSELCGNKPAFCKVLQKANSLEGINK